MTRTPVTSSTIVSVGYDAATQTLEVEFKTGVYRYAGVTAEAHGALMAATSIGSFVHHSIKPFYPVTKVTEEQA